MALVLLGLSAAADSGVAQGPVLSPETRAFVQVDAATTALVHVRVIDGTGAEPRPDQTVVIDGGLIRAVGDSARVPIPAGARVLDLAGRTVLPGFVMVHEHMFYPGVLWSEGYMANDQAFSFPRLYLAGGATTIRTGGSLEPYTDLELKAAIDSGRTPGPKMDVTGPYLQGPGFPLFYQMHVLKGPDDARRTVEYWAGLGVTSFKAYMNITRDELGTAIKAAHARGIKVTGHLCSVTFHEAAALGIDDLEHKAAIDSGRTPGPKMDVTGPYLQGPGFPLFYQMHVLKGPDDARRTVEYWAGLGATSFKAYMNITRDELGAAIKAAHARGIKVTGHLCSVTFHEAAALGIDDLEHGLMVASDFVVDKKPDECPDDKVTPSLLALDMDGEPVKALIRDLVAHRVAVTSTLPVFETFGPHRPPLPDKVLDVMTADARIAYLRRRALIADRGDTTWTVLLGKEMAFERAFAQAGGLLISGTDPTGYGGVVAGFSNQREVELLVEAGFTPLEAISIATLNGAKYLGREQRVGTVAAGKQADLIVVHGDPSANIADIENVELVFKDGVGYDPAKLIASVRGKVGLN